MQRWMNRWTAAVAAAVGLVVVASLFAFGGPNGSPPVPVREKCLIGGEQPCSTNVEAGKAYAFQVLHCGLVWVVDFDGSYWDVDKATMTADEDGRFGINSDEGTMTLEGRNVAVYRSLRGGDATLHRHVGAPNFFNCA